MFFLATAVFHHVAWHGTAREGSGVSVDNPRDVPEQYRPLFEKRGIDFTYRALHRKVEGVGLNSVVRALTGQGRLSDRVAEGVSAALGVTPNELHALRGHPIAEPFQLPVRASELNQRERDAVLGVVRALLDARDLHDTDQPASDADRPPASGTQGETHKDEKTSGRIVRIAGQPRGDKPDDLPGTESSPDAEDHDLTTSEDRQSDYDLVHRTRRRGVPVGDPEAYDSTIGEQPDPEGPEGGA